MLWDSPGPAFPKDTIHNAVIDGMPYHPSSGTKAASHYILDIEANASSEVWIRYTNAANEHAFDDFEDVFRKRFEEFEDFYRCAAPPSISEQERAIQIEAFAGLLWSKKFYHYGVELWAKGDPIARPPKGRGKIRNGDWKHFYANEVLSMPDSWEYPWFAAWDLAFHCVPIALVDPVFAKRQLILLLREWYMHPNGQLPAYEWNFGDVNPPVHAWAALRVYQTEVR
jgi:hypothetical protein